MTRKKKPDWREEVRAWFAAEEEKARQAAEAERLAAETRNQRRARTRPSRAKPKRTRKPGYSRAHWPHYPVEGPLLPDPEPGKCMWCTEVTFRFGCGSTCPNCPRLTEGDEKILDDRLRRMSQHLLGADLTSEDVAILARERQDTLLVLHENGWDLDRLADSYGVSRHWVRDLVRKAQERRELASGMP